MTSINQTVEKVLKYCADNNILGGEPIYSIFIRTSSLVEEDVAKSPYTGGLYEFHRIVPIEIVVNTFGNYVYYATHEELNNHQFVIDFDELVKIWGNKIPYIKINRRKEYRFVYDERTPYLSYVEIYTRKQTWLDREYYNMRNHFNRANNNLNEYWQNMNDIVTARVHNFKYNQMNEFIPQQEIQDMEL